MGLDEIVQKFGITAGLLLYFIWRDYKTSKEYNDYIKDIASKAVAALDKSTTTQENANAIMERFEHKLDRGR